MTSVDFTACFEWLNEDWQSIGLWPTPNFGLTGYKTHYLLCYVGARGLETDRERDDWMKVKLCRKKKSLKSERTGKGQNRGKFITRRQTADAQRKRTVNNGPLLELDGFHGAIHGEQRDRLPGFSLARETQTISPI